MNVIEIYVQIAKRILFADNKLNKPNEDVASKKVVYTFCREYLLIQDQEELKNILHLVQRLLALGKWVFDHMLKRAKEYLNNRRSA